MSGDFVKQLQLAKQLEQKAKEAARGRETAEGKVQEATSSLAKLKEIGAPTVETEKMLTLASQSYSDKDYKEALSYAVKSVEASERARKERLQEILRDATDLLQRVASLGDADEGTNSALETASKAIDSEDLDRAYELCKDAWDRSERNANRVVSEAFGQAQSSLLFAERLELKVDKQKTALRNCRDALESGNIAKSVDLIQSLLGVLKGMTMERFVQRSGKIEGLLALENGLDVNMEEAKKFLDEGRENIAMAKVEEAFFSLDGAEEAFSRAFGKAVGTRVEELRRRVHELASHQYKMELGDLQGNARRLELDEKYTETVALLDSAREKVRAAEKEVLLKGLSGIQPRLRLAHMVKKDVSAALKSIESARSSLKADRFSEAFKLVDEAREVIEERLQGYDEVESELRVAQELRSRCDDLQLPCSDGLKSMGEAKRLTMRGDFTEAIESLRQSQRHFKLTLENHFATGIMRLEMRLATAMRLGADVSEESMLLEDLTSRVRKGDFELVHGSLITIGGSVEEKTTSVVSEELRKVEEIMSHHTGPGSEKAMESLNEARKRLGGKEFQAAHDLADAILNDMQNERRKNLDRSLQDAHTLLDMAGRLGAESVTLRDKMQRSEELKTLGRVDEASLLAEEVVSYGRSIVNSEVDRQLTDLMHKISMARKDGVEVDQSEHITEQASIALRKEELAQAFDLTISAKGSLNEVLALHQRLKERLLDNEALLEEAKRSNVDVAGIQEAVIHAGMLLRSGRYVDARQELDRAEEELRLKASPIILASKLKQMEDMAKLRDRLGYKESRKGLEKLGALDASKLDDSLGALSKLREEWEGELSAFLDKELKACQKEIDKAAVSGTSISHVQQILARGRSALNERKLVDAMHAVELVRGELDQSAQADRRLIDLLATVEDAIDQLKEMKVDARDATVLLEQARALKRTGNSMSAADLAKRAQDRSLTLARERVLAMMNFAGGLTNEREGWEDMRTARKLNDDIQEALRNHRYRHSHLLARSFREELERVLQDKAQAEDELLKFETRLKEEAKSGFKPESSKKALEKARTLLAQGRFVQALSNVHVARDELRAMAEMYESRLTEYNSLRESLNSLELLDPRKDNIEELLDQCWSSLKQLQFEQASLYLRRARNALNEFLTMRTNELLWEFNPLHDLIKRLKLQGKFSAEIAEIERSNVEAANPRDLNRLSRNVDLVRAAMKDVFEEQREKARRFIEKASRSGKQTGRSWEVWSDSETQASKGDLWEAFNSLETAVNAIGRKAGETPEQLSKQLSEMLENANRLRIELQRTEKAYGDALELQKAGKNPMEQLKKACEISRKEVRGTYPDITAELQFVGEALEGRPVDVIVHLKNEAKYDARKVRAFIFGDVDVKGMVEAEVLKAGESTKGRITIVPMKPGLLSLGISVKCKPLLTEEDVLYDSKFDLDVK